jgi:excisionase family DNA binding protein
MEAGESASQWLNTREASRWLDVPVRTLYQLIDDGELPAYHSGPDIMLRRFDVDSYRGRAPGNEETSPS